MPFYVETGKSKISFEGKDYGTLTCNYLLEKVINNIFYQGD